MNKHTKRYFILLACLSAFFMLLSHALVTFETTYTDYEISQHELDLEKTARIKSKAVQNKYKVMINSLKSLADNLTDENVNVDDVIQQLNLLISLGYFDHAAVSNEKGRALNTEGKIIDVSFREYFTQAMNNVVSISDVISNELKEDTLFQIVAVPINYDGTVKGAVLGVVKVGHMDSVLDNEANAHIYSQIVDSKGNYISGYNSKDSLIQSTNVWEDFTKFEFLEGSIERIRNDIRHSQANSFVFRFGDEERLSYYAPLGLNDYYIFTTIDNENITNRISIINDEAITLLLESGLGFLILLVGIIWYNQQVRKELNLNQSEALSNARMMEIAIAKTKHYVFYYDQKNHRIIKKAGVNNVLFPDNYIENIPYSIIDNGLIDEQSIADFKELFGSIMYHDSITKTIKICKNDAIYWFKIILNNIYDDHHKILNTVGIVEDISEKKLQEELYKKGQKEKVVLQQRAEIDELTGLYNAQTIKQKISTFISYHSDGESRHLFILMDIDNFKQINDTFGHGYGDYVLQDVSRILSNHFRKTDLIGRLGGDEFVMLLVGVRDFEALIPTLDDLLTALNKTYTVDGNSVTISVSLGCVETPLYGTKFKELYAKSDKMLYEVKKENKNGMKLYQ